MSIMTTTRPRTIPDEWDRRGLPAWTYHSKAMFNLECETLFLTHWQIAGHVGDIPAPGDWLTFDLLGERALVMRGQDGVVRAFHNLCRHRGARLADGTSGHCKGAMVCPFHGWVYNLDGSLRGAARPESFGGMDRSKFGLKPIEMDIWHGFIFLRFAPGPQPGIGDLMAPYNAEFADYGAQDLLPAEPVQWATTLPVNWKSVRDVDNEGYHVAMAHPALQELYGPTYRDEFNTNGINRSIATYGDRPGRKWSVRNYVKISPVQERLPVHLQRAWTYYGIFPNAVIAFTPEGAQYYQDIPFSPQQTRLQGRLYRYAHEDRPTRLARYLAMRIDRETSAEDQQLSIWSNESMKSTAFDNFHLSDLEYGLRAHHDQLRRILPVMNQNSAPQEWEIAGINANMISNRAQNP